MPLTPYSPTVAIMKQRTYRPHSRKLTEGMQELADSLLMPLVNRFLLAELFWEETRRTIIDFNADGFSSATHEGIRGAQFRVVDESSAATSWTTDLTARGLLRAFRNLGVAATPRRLSSWPEENKLRVTSSPKLLSWREAAADLMATARRLLHNVPKVEGHFSCDEYVRGSSSGPGEGRERRGQSILVKINAVRKDGTPLRRTRLFQGRHVTPNALMNSGLLKISKWLGTMNPGMSVVWPDLCR